MNGYFKWQTVEIAYEKTWTYLSKGNLKSETEVLLIVAPNNAIRTSDTDAKIDNTRQNMMCRFCRETDETVNHSNQIQQTSTMEI